MSRPLPTILLFAVAVLMSAALAPADFLSATFVGGSDYDNGHALALSPTGNLIIAGRSQSSDFPTTAGAYDQSLNGNQDVFIAILSPQLDALVAGTFIGGSSIDFARDILIGPSGVLLVVGETMSSDFPTTPGAYDPSYNGGHDVFLVKMTPDLSALALSSFLGGSGDDYGESSALDPSGKLVVAGSTSSAAFPVTPGSYDTGYNGGPSDAFLSRLSLLDGRPLASTFIGTSNYEGGRNVTTDENGSVLLVGSTHGSFPVTLGVFDTTYNGGNDVFVLRMPPDLSALLASTYIGGSGDDVARAISRDAEGGVYIAGTTSSEDFPVTPGAYDTTFHAPQSFVLRLSHEMDAVPFSTFFGGMFDGDHAQQLAIRPSKSVLVAGTSINDVFPYNPDCFLLEFSTELNSLLAFEIAGGNEREEFGALLLDGDGSCLVAGGTVSPDFPATAGAYDTSYNWGAMDAFLARWQLGGFDTVFAAMECFPDAITLPSTCRIQIGIRNMSQAQRLVDAGLSIELPDGALYENFRFGSLSISGGDSFDTFWRQSFPAIPALEGTSVLRLRAEDVTPSPYNQPPYPPSGAVDSKACTLQIIVP